MRKQRSRHGENAGKSVNMIDHEFVTLTNGQKEVTRENTNDCKLSCRMIILDIF